MEPELEIHSVVSRIGTPSSSECDESLNRHAKKTFTVHPLDCDLSNQQTDSLITGIHSLAFVSDISSGQSHDLDDMSSDGVSINRSIRIIREEAARLSAVLDADELVAVKEELLATQRKLGEKDTELHRTKLRIAQSQTIIGHLQLERDLFKADAERFENELGILTERIKSLEVKTSKYLLHSQGNSHQSPFAASLMEQCWRTDGGSPTLGISSKAFMYSQISDERADPVIDAGASLDDDDEENRSPRKYHSSRGKRWLAVMRRRRTRNPLSAAVSTTIDFSTLNDDPKVYLQNRLKLSLQTEVDLRRRLAELCWYYDDLVRRLQENLLDEKCLRVRLQAELVDKLAKCSRHNHSIHFKCFH